MRHLILTVLFCFIGLTVWGQSAQKAEKLFYDKQYNEAAAAYKYLIKSSQNTLYYYRYARCLYELKQYDEAIRYFMRAGKKYSLTNFYIGESYFRDYKFDLANEYFSKYHEAIDSTNANWSIVEHRLRQCQVCERYIKRVRKIEYLDTLRIARNKFLSAYHLSAETGQLSVTDSMLVTYTNGMNNRKISTNSNGNHTSLYVSDKLINGWTDTMHFYSETDANVNFPFLLNDGMTLYFASDNTDGIGGLDIYKTRYNSDSNDFLRAENIGFPFNSPYNDYMLAIDETLGLGYFCTDRYCPADSVLIVKFKYNDEVHQYYSSSDNDSIVRKQAQIRDIEFSRIQQSDTATAPAITKPIVNKTIEQSISFYITDSIEYNDYSEFKSNEARQLFVSLEQDRQTYQSNLKQLELLRIEYANAAAEQRTQMAPKILELEQSIASYPSQLRNKEREIRKLEIESF